jgi:hypothetical protein
MKRRNVEALGAVIGIATVGVALASVAQHSSGSPVQPVSTAVGSGQGVTRASADLESMPRRSSRSGSKPAGRGWVASCSSPGTPVPGSRSVPE